ncbi:hypothetical protein PRIPAC_77076 [Pristionchus pacificus]|uniref:ShKT domain-containing protein n=1 Tax=Pristionchus pacificus TaxID=54126 RepID=A0A2A6CPM3_PRIPA|nr:hypothetical protein PRIPAC_77076 [Pristionchus pacificus]|eukprot:PDM80056.1 hypothetical protein PRIPAC_32635 [Pristionchus pacificus]
MSRVILAIVASSALFGSASAVTCAPADNVNCPTWIKAGFCDSYSPVTLAANCPKSCPKAGCGATAVPSTNTTTGGAATENKNCQKWNEDPKNVFCAKATDVQKKTFCNKTCAAEITPVDDCGIYVNTGGKVVRTGFKKSNPAAAVETKATATNTLMNLFAKDKCKIDLYPTAAPTVGTGIIKSYTGAAPSTFFFPITVTAEQAAASIVCTCT